MSFQHSPDKKPTCTSRQQAEEHNLLPFQILSQSSRNQEIIACPQIILYQLGCDLLSGEALEFEATLNFKVETLFTYTMYMYALMKIAESSVTVPSFFCAADFHSALLLLTTRSWTITASDLKIIHLSRKPRLYLPYLTFSNN